MIYRTQTEGTVGTVFVEGRFTFEAHQIFKAASEPLLETPGLQELHLDLSAVHYMDSSALGMVLLLRERAGAGGLEVVLAHPTPSVQAVLQIVHFGKLFRILP